MEDRIRQQKIELMELEREVETARRELKEIREDIELKNNELKDLKPLKKRDKEEYNIAVVETIKKNRKSEQVGEEVKELEIKKQGILVKLDDDILIKNKELKSFKNKKSDFIKSLEEREQEIEDNKQQLLGKIDELEEKENEITYREENVKNGLKTIEKREGAVRQGVKDNNATQKHLKGLESDTLRDRQEAKDKKNEIEEELEKQQELTEKLENHKKLVDSKEEVLIKTKEFLNREEIKIKQDQAKLKDDRRSFNRAMADKYGKKFSEA